ncbi:hypothetical protein ES703_15538 [subsurface metagenome]
MLFQDWPPSNDLNTPSHASPVAASSGMPGNSPSDIAKSIDR